MAGNTAAIGMNAMGRSLLHACMATLAEFVSSEPCKGLVNGFCRILFMNRVAVCANYARSTMLALLPLAVLMNHTLVIRFFDKVIVKGFSDIITVWEGIPVREAFPMRGYLLGAQPSFVALTADHCTKPP